MFNRSVGVICALLLARSAVAQTLPMEGPPAITKPTTAMEQKPSAAQTIIPRETPVHLMFLNEGSTKTARAGDRFVLVVQEAVVVNDEILIPENAEAWGVVEETRESGAAGKAGRLSAKLVHVEGRNGLIPLSGSTASAGPRGATQTVLGVLGLGPLGLFARGSNAKLKAGESITGYVAEDVAYRP